MAPKLSVGEITGTELRGILEEELTRVFSPDPFRHSGGWFGGYAGLQIELDLSRPDGRRIVELRRPSGEPIADDDVVRVASCVRPFDGDGVMCSHGGFANVREVENPATGHAWTPLELVVRAFEEAAIVPAPVGEVLDLAQVDQWPRSPFTQPLMGE